MLRLHSQYLEELAKRLHKGGKSASGKGGKAKPINLDKASSDEDADEDDGAEDDADEGDLNDQAKAKFKILDGDLRKCQKCGPAKRCRINSLARHDNDITHQMVNMWATAWV
jgi:hypothetical protein